MDWNLEAKRQASRPVAEGRACHVPIDVARVGWNKPGKAFGSFLVLMSRRAFVLMYVFCFLFYIISTNIDI